ncbi:MAG: adenosylcobinamide-GDP ribazoletransferase [Planctomycetota bacterium]
MKFLIALQFLTIIPVKIKKHFGEREIAQSMFFYPFAGIIIGLILAGSYYLAYPYLNSFAASVIVVAILAVLTGGLHLDGLTDTADALFSNKNGEEKLRIMKSSHIGAMGAAALTISILLKVSLINALPQKSALFAIILMPAAGRCSLLIPALLFRYAREEEGTGSFIKSLGLGTVLPAVIITVLISTVMLQLPGLCSIIIAFVISVLLGKFIAIKIGGMTGDTLGAINEVCEVIFIGTICVLEGGMLCGISLLCLF